MTEAAAPSHYRHQTGISRSTATTTTTTTTTATSTMTPFLSPQPSNPSRAAPGPRTPSPNYFDFRVDNDSYISDSPQHPRNHWSSPSSAVRSAAAQSPAVVPHDKNPSLDAFKRQSDGKAFNLSGLNHFKPGNGSQPAACSPTTNLPPSQETERPSRSAPRDMPSQRAHRSGLDPSSAELSRSPKRLLSPGSATESTRRGSPPTYSHGDGVSEPQRDDALDGQPRFKLPLDALNRSYDSIKERRAESSIQPKETDSDTMVPPSEVAHLIDSDPHAMLLLDLRLATQFTVSHISSALNLCMPTTLLKRPSFNVQKLADTFKDNAFRRIFEHWRDTKHIVVYDANSTASKDAAICVHTLNKFRTEGYKGTLQIIQGGFRAFADQFPSYLNVDGGNASAHATLINGDGPKVAPVVGGCPMPVTSNPANPFFSNIRQNMDLIGGVGQIPLTHPSKATPAAETVYPEWLKEAASDRDQGKQVSNKFERIERREKERMEDALCGKVTWDSNCAVQIAGLEQGSKNRYNNIWPFEHSRVKLQGVPRHECDYFNANFIQASGSNKRYISTQAPIPATFNDFWNVVWQQDVRVIVMLTAEKEGAQVKAHNYWSEPQYGGVHLKFLSEKRASLDPKRIRKYQKRAPTLHRASTNSINPSVPLATIDSSESQSSDQPYVIVRKFSLSHERFPFENIREITQLQYSHWPDFGAPTHPAHLVGLVEQCDAVVRVTNNVRTSLEPEPEFTRPVMVHCSAGCGRTGTFCTVDSVIDMLKRQRISQSPTETVTTERDDRASKASNQARPTGAAAGFFAASHSSTNASKGINGAWVHQDNQDLVEKTVEEFRHQRISMVQSLQQYVLCYNSIMEWLVEQEQSHQSA